MNADLAPVIATLNELLEDASLPKSVRNVLKQTLETLEKSEDRVSISRALSALEEVADSTTMQPDHRTILFNVVSMLETV